MSRNWYVVQTYSNYEQSIEQAITSLIKENKVDPEVVIQAKVPMREVEETKTSKKKSSDSSSDEKVKKIVKKSIPLLPGYVMVEMDLPTIGWKDVCSQIRRIRGVVGFPSTKPSEKPRPISAEDAKKIFIQTGEIKGAKPTYVVQGIDAGDRVRITEGPFASFEGVVDEVFPEKRRLRVTVPVFGRATPVELDVVQVEKL